MRLSFITPSAPIRCPKLWKEFSAPAGAAGTLRITGLGLYRAYLNGQRVGDEYLTPGCNDYGAYLRYQTYDVSALLRAENRLEVWLGEGWYMGRFGLDEHNENRFGDRFLLAARLTLTGADGAETALETDESWLAARSPITQSSIYDGEWRDDTLDPGAPVPCARASYPVEPEEPISPPIRVRAELRPTLLVTPKGEQVLDFGQNLAGVLRFTNRLPRGASLRIQTGEVLQEGCFYRENLRSALSEYHYVSDGVVKEIEPLFTFYGFRYARVEGLERVDPADFTALALCSDLRETLACETDHPLLNQLLRNTLWGQRGNFLDVPTDCPQRDERLGWTADTQVFVNTACYQMDCKAFYRKFMRDMRVDQTLYYNGDIPMYSPSLRGAAGPGGAVWADAGTIIPWNVYWNYGDLALLRETYPMMRDYVQTLIDADERAGGTHLLFPCFTFGDWLAQDGLTPQTVWGGTENAYIQGAYYLGSLRLAARAAGELGEQADAARYGALAEAVHAALVDEYVTPGGRLAVDTQTAYVLALRYGIHREKAKLLEGFRRRLKRDFYRLTCGFTGAPLLLPALLDNGLVDEAYRVLLTEGFPGWLFAVKQGATTVWERWNSLDEQGRITGTEMNSLNHYAYGSVCEAVYSRIMGLQNAAPGWRRARIAPQLNGRLRHSRIRFDSPAGTYEVAWDLLADGSLSLAVIVPEGAEADIVLPDHPEGLALTVTGGAYAYAYRPARDLLHPYSENSLLLDLLECPAANALLREHAPALYAQAARPGSELRVQTLAEALPDGPEREALRAALAGASPLQP